MEYCVSPAVKNVLACNNRDGETVDGSVVDSLAPDVVIARLMNGTASSIRSINFLMAWIISLISTSFCAFVLVDAPPRRAISSAAAALAKR